MKKTIPMKINPEFEKINVTEIAYAELYGVDNTKPLSAEILQLFDDEIKKISTSPDDFLENNPTLQGYREKVKLIGRSLKKFPPSAEVLVKIVKKKGGFFYINPIVDIYNLFALRSYLSFGAHDLDLLKGGITFRTSSGNEAFRAIGSEEDKMTAEGDYVYADEEKVLAWLDSKDSELVKISAHTKNVIIIIQGNNNTSLQYRLDVLKELCEMITAHCGGEYQLNQVSLA